jgi:hypothetical protein
VQYYNGRYVPQPAATGERPSGSQAVVGAMLAVVGVLAAANPQNLILQAISAAAPQLADAVPTLITVCGAIIAACSTPPNLRR